MHLAAQVLALAQGGGHVEQQLGQVAADLALDPDRHHDPLEVRLSIRVRDALERVFQGDTEPALDDDALELARRSGSLPSRTTVSIDWASDSPAERLPDISWSVSGRSQAEGAESLLRFIFR